MILSSTKLNPILKTLGKDILGLRDISIKSNVQFRTMYFLLKSFFLIIFLKMFTRASKAVYCKRHGSNIYCGKARIHQHGERFGP